MLQAQPCHFLGHLMVAALALTAAVAEVPPATAADLVTIEHRQVHCVVAGKYPELDACFDPSSRVARARVYFKGDGAIDWYYVEMKAASPCFRGVLPRPKKTLKAVSYYVEVTDVDFVESRTEEYAARVVPDDKSCAEGPVAPFVTTASVLVGGASALPAGFVGGGLLAGVGTTALVTGAAVVGAGAAGAVIAGGGGEEPPAPTTQPPGPAATTTTTQPPGPVTTTTTTTPPADPTTTTTTTVPTTTTTTTVPTTTTTTTLPTTTTTTVPACPDSAAPEVRILSPEDNSDVAARLDVVAEATDPGPVSSGIRQVRIYAEEQGGSRSAPIATLPGPGPTFRASWSLPPCLGPQDRWYVNVEATDRCGTSTRERVRVKRRSDTCMASSSAEGTSPVERTTLGWTSELSVPGGKGQVIANGSFVLFPGPGRSELVLPARPGPNRLEAVLVEGEGPGTWGFTLASGGIRPGSLRALAGEAVAGPQSAVFRLRGRAGERVVIAFDAE
jgi:hypothetical protein